jgi:4-hydroxybenzoate polyprenyltransferase
MQMSVWRSAGVTLEMIKWEHSIFALPFALTGAMLAARGFPAGKTLFWILVCMVAARSAAMAFNRLVDADLDAANPRTAARALPAGQLSRGFVGAFTLLSSAIFLLGASQLNRLTLWLAPLALAILFAYSYTKRCTRWSHLVLGLSLGIAPAAAWIAVRGSLSPPILALTAAVLCWVAGFDMLYACQDFEHDRRVGLRSIPASLGLTKAFWLARGLHLAAFLLLMAMVPLFGLGKIALAGVLVVGLLLLYEHSLVSPKDLSRLNAAFFTMNGVISMVYFLFTAAELLWLARH